MIKVKVLLLVCIVIVSISSVLADDVVDSQLGEFPVRFVIMGDRTGNAVPGIYEQMVDEAERLKPDFVMTVGDMIEGYTEDTTVLNNEWTEYLSIVDKFSCPIYYVPGNHDITFESMIDWYNSHVTESPYYSFDHRGLHFVILDNSRFEYSKDWPEEQLEWLKEDLSKNKDATYTLVFYHKPMWYNTIAVGENDRLHDIFVEYGVDAVFNGHYHTYFVGEYDGIKYTTIGSSGGGMSPGPSGLGYHIAWVTVTDKDIYTTPISIEGILPWNEVAADDLHFIGDLEKFAISFNNKVPVSENLKINNASLNITIQNLNDQSVVNDTLVWDVPLGWSVEPSKMHVLLPPKHKSDFHFDISCSGDLYPVPAISAGFPFKDTMDFKVTQELYLSRSINCVKADKPPKIDGKISEKIWSDPEDKFYDPDQSIAKIDPVDFYFAHDDENLYIAAHCLESKMDSLYDSVEDRDGAVYGGDCIGFFFQPDVTVDTVYQIYISPKGMVFDQKISFDITMWYTAVREWNGDYIVASSKNEDSWDVEVQIPLAELNAKAESGQSWGLNFRRKQKRLNTSGDWQVPIDYNPITFGELKMQ